MEPHIELHKLHVPQVCSSIRYTKYHTSHHSKPITLSELVKALQIPKTKCPYVYRLMHILVHSGFFAIQKIHEAEETQDGYVLTPSSKLLLKGHAKSMSPLVLMTLDPVLVTPHHFIREWFQMRDEQITPFENTNGLSFWKYFGENPERGKLFDEAMACDSRLVMSVMLKECKMKFEGLKLLVDVGGSTGAMGRILAETFPSMKCTVVDLPHVVGAMQGSKNVEFVSGDMFESVPSADAFLLKWVMHNWGDEECLKILKQCKKAIPSREEGGKIIIIDMVVDDSNNKENYESTETQLFFDMLMMVLLNGKQRTEIEWKRLFVDAGFSGYNITPILGLRSFIEVFP